MDTSSTLLDMLKSSENERAWDLLTNLYSPLIRRWLKSFQSRVSDEDDVVQEVLIQVSRKITTFDLGQRTGSFRNWLKKITINCLRNYQRKRANRLKVVGGSDFDGFIGELEDPHSAISQKWDREHESYVLRYLLKTVEPKFKPATWKAFYETAVKSRSAKEVAQELDTTPGAIHTSRSRVLAEIRKLGKGLLAD